MRKSLKKYGAHGRTVRVLTDDVRGGTLVRVRWREGGRTRTESWPDTKENRRLAIAFAETTNHRLAHRIAEPPPAIALSALFAKYCSANTHWRPTTLSNTQARWKKFELVAGPGRMAHSVTPDLLDRFRAEMRKIGHAPNQTVEMVKVVRAVFRFAKLRRLIGENPLDGYTVRLAKDEQRTEMFEYTPDEWAGLLAQLSPRKALQWRAYCLLTLGGLLGPRQNALRHLTWDDLDLDARTVTWRRGFDKLGKERPQPLPRDAVRCFRIARVWARRDGYDGRWVFYGAQERTRSKPYTYQALNAYLRVAEEKAGINHIRHRAMHGLRRTAAGNALEASGGNIRAAGDWIGDSDLRTLSRYLKRREVRQRELAAVMSAPRAAVTSAEVKPNRHQNVTVARQEAAEEELSAAIAP